MAAPRVPVPALRGPLPAPVLVPPAAGVVVRAPDFAASLLDALPGRGVALGRAGVGRAGVAAGRTGAFDAGSAAFGAGGRRG
ncbi:MAG TPA: hypothetical protein VF710_09645, partial [Longimicrobium sp.]